MATIGYATLPIIPSMQGISGNLSQLIGAPIVAAGQQAGQDAGRAVGRGMAGGMSASQSTVEAASAKLAAARGKEADAAGKVRVAELKLQELRDKGTATVSQIAAAEERLATAERGRDTAVSNRLRAVNDLTQARARAANGADDEASSIDDSTDAQERNADGAVDLAKKLGGLAIAAAGIGSAMDLATQSLEKSQLGSKLAASFGETPEEAKRYGEVAGNLYADGIGESMEDVAASVAAVGGTFGSLDTMGGARLEELSAKASNFAKVFDQDVSGSVQTAGMLMQNGLADNADQAFDMMTRGMQEVSVSMRDELPEILQEYGTNFRALGFDGESSFDLLIDAASKGKFALDKTGDALKEFTIRGSDMSASSTEAFQSMGLDAQLMASDIAVGGENAQYALQKTADALLGIEDPSTRANTAIALFGSPLEDMSVDQIPMFLESLSGAPDVMGDVTGATDEMSATLNDNAGSAVENLKRAIQGGVLEALENMADWVGRNSETLKTIGMIIAPLAIGFLAYKLAVIGITAATTAWNTIQMLLNGTMALNPIGAVVAIIALLVAGIVIAYNKSETFRNIVQAAWQGIQDAISFAWNNIIKPIWDALLVALGKVGEFFTWVWNSVIKPAWDGLAAGISWAWENIIRPAWDGLQAGLSAVGDLFRSVWENVIKPAWDGLGAGISWVWENVIKKAWDGLKEGLETVKNSFSTAVDFIGKVWDGIKGIVAKPVKFVVETVYNNGIRGAWNKVAGWLNLPELPEAQLGELGNYAKGTAVLPGYSPGVDNMRFVSTDGSTAINLGGGEGIVRPEVTKAVGTSWIDGVNSAASRGGVSGVKNFLGNYDTGGVVDGSLWNAAHAAFPNATLNSAFRPGHSGYHGKAQAVDLGGPMQQIADWIYETYPDSAQLIWGPGPLLYNVGGNKISDQSQLRNQVYAGDLPGHYDHVHWASDGPIASDGQMISDAGGGSGGGGFFGAIKNWLRNRVADAFDKVIDPIGNAIPTFGDSMVGQLPKTVFGYMKDKVRGWLLGKADEQDTSSGGTVPQGTGPAVDQIKAAFAPYGWDTGDQWAAVDWIIGKESGWQADARNASSGAFGYFQFNPSSGTLQEYLPDYNTNPGVQGAAGAKYIRDRYGDPLAAKAFWEANGHYDQGGLAVGKGLLSKDVLAPERVLSPSETKAWEMLVPHLVSLVPALEHFESVVTSPAFTSAQSLLADGEFTPGFRESFGVEESSPIVNAVLGVRDQLKGIAPDLFGTTSAAAGEATGEVDSLGAVEPGMETGPTEPIGGSGVASSYGEGAQGNPEVDKWTEWAQNAGKQWEDYFKDNWKEMLNTAVGVGLGSRGGGGDTFNMNGNSDTQVAKVIQRNQRRKSLAQQRSGGFGRG